MKRYITRHGQVSASRQSPFGHLLPVGDNPLSDLGCRQARMLGIRMREIGFKGIIVSSPYIRTMQTADIIAEETGCLILPFAPFREIVFTPNPDFVGSSIEDIRRNFPHIHPDAELPPKWWNSEGDTQRVEVFDDVYRRVLEGIKYLEEKYPDTELLFVGHGASVGAMFRLLKVPRPRNYVVPFSFNCSLSMVDTADPTVEPFGYSTDHIPYQQTTSNFLSREEFDLEYFAKEWPYDIVMPEGAAALKGSKLLHIGDTHSAYYPYYRKLIEVTKPDIIIHTGDFADETKVGRIPEDRYEYTVKLKCIAEMLNNSGARLIVVPGNNDLPDELQNLMPAAEIYPTNTLLNIGGVEIRIGHQSYMVDSDKDWAFYGHGFTWDKWDYSKNAFGGPCRFNAFKCSTLCSLSEGKFYCFTPETLSAD